MNAQMWEPSHHGHAGRNVKLIVSCPYSMSDSSQDGQWTNVKQIGHNANVRKQEEEIAVGIVLVIVRRAEVAAGPHNTTAACLRQKKGCVQNRVAGTRKHKHNM